MGTLSVTSASDRLASHGNEPRFCAPLVGLMLCPLPCENSPRAFHRAHRCLRLLFTGGELPRLSPVLPHGQPAQEHEHATLRDSHPGRLGRPARVSNGMHSPGAPVTLDTIARILLTASTAMQQTLVDVVAPTRGRRSLRRAPPRRHAGHRCHSHQAYSITDRARRSTIARTVHRHARPRGGGYGGAHR